MKSKSEHRQADLFEWAENRPTAEVIDFEKRLIDRIYENIEYHDAMAEVPRPRLDAEIVPLRRHA